jgi:acyl-CoA thioesterase
MVHGGAIFTMADYAFALASNSVAPPSVALSVSIQFLRPGKAGTLYASARLQASSGRVGTYLVEVKDDSGDLVASFQGLAYCKANGPKGS